MHTFIDIALNNCCTYTCDYCISHASRATAINYNEKGTYIPNGHALRTNELICFLKQFPNDTIIQLTGGEPLIYPAFELLAEQLLTKFKNVIVNTNGNQLWRIPQELKDKLYWRTSWHPDYRNIRAFLDDIKGLPPERILINYIAHPKRIADNSINEHITDLEIDACVKMAYQYEITCFEGKWNELNYNKTWHQYAQYSTYYTKPEVSQDKEYIFINANGDIKKCDKTTIGNIYDNPEDFKFPECRGCAINNCEFCGLAYATKKLGIIGGQDG